MKRKKKRTKKKKIFNEVIYFLCCFYVIYIHRKNYTTPIFQFFMLPFTCFCYTITVYVTIKEQKSVIENFSYLYNNFMFHI